MYNINISIIMKKIFSSLFILFIAVQTIFAADVITKDINQLPKGARDFISTYFPNYELQQIKIDKEALAGTTYDVYFTNGAEFEFDKKGNWTEIDLQKTGEIMPKNLVPPFAAKYLKDNKFVNEYVTKIDRDKNGCEVTLNDGKSFEFDSKGKFKKMDD